MQASEHAHTRENGHLKVGLIAKSGAAHTGVGRYVEMLNRNLKSRGVPVERVSPWVPDYDRLTGALKGRLNIDVSAFLSNYPVWARYPEASVLHFTSQNLASLLMIRRADVPTLVTVHDIIPYLLRDETSLSAYRGVFDRRFDSLAMGGLKHADYLIADSAYTKRSLIEQLHLCADRIEVVHLGIDHDRFRPVNPSPTLYNQYGLRATRRFLIYVGSEDPRKNLKTLINALALVRRQHDDVELIKVGRPHNQSERVALTNQAERLGIRAAIHFLDDVPESDLPALYSLAKICVMPSLYEGFGFPVLESMACGTPVVCSNAASLPELASDAALQFTPGVDAPYRLASAITHILADRALAQRLRYAGLEQAAQFTWKRTTDQMLDAYVRVSESERGERRSLVRRYYRVPGTKGHRYQIDQQGQPLP